LARMLSQSVAMGAGAVGALLRVSALTIMHPRCRRRP
jgi:hypothetical protein